MATKYGVIIFGRPRVWKMSGFEGTYLINIKFAIV
jgi:hypothetical protein